MNSEHKMFDHTGDVDVDVLIGLIEESMQIAESDADQALSQLLTATSALNVALQKDPRVVRKLRAALHPVRSALHAIAVKSQAESFTVSVGVPAGIQVSVTWEP